MKSIFEYFPIVDGSYNDAVKYISALLYFGQIDGLHIDEEKAILELIDMHGWSREILKDAKSAPISCIEDLQLSSETVRVFAPYLLRDSIGICYVHNGYSVEEKLAVLNLARELCVSQEDLSKIENAVHLQIQSITIWSEF